MRTATTAARAPTLTRPRSSATPVGDRSGTPAGPAINPLIKVMNLVSVLVAPAIVTLSIGGGENAAVRYGIAATAFLIVVAAVAVSKRRGISITDGGDGENAPARTSLGLVQASGHAGIKPRRRHRERARRTPLGHPDVLRAAPVRGTPCG